jgi:hypothetical protein
VQLGAAVVRAGSVAEWAIGGVIGSTVVWHWAVGSACRRRQCLAGGGNMAMRCLVVSGQQSGIVCLGERVSH